MREGNIQLQVLMKVKIYWDQSPWVYELEELEVVIRDKLLAVAMAEVAHGL